MAAAVFGGGCFWCTEAVFQALDGVSLVEPGYCGGHVDEPTYEQVCDGQTGHIEVVRITYDPAVIAFSSLLEVFFATHDPTTPGRQGNDVGPQYQSAVFYGDDEQKRLTSEMIEALDRAGVYSAPICTSVLPAAHFWVAEDYHHNYFARNPTQGYCQFVIAPKVGKFQQQFGAKLK
jgi:peptide-methionine (S)-S-oxide reductase